MLFDPFGLKPGDLIGFNNLDEVKQFTDTLIESGIPICIGRLRHPISELVNRVESFVDRQYGFPVSVYIEGEQLYDSYLFQATGKPEDLVSILRDHGDIIGSQYWFSDLPKAFPTQPNDDLPTVDLSDFLE